MPDPIQPPAPPGRAALKAEPVGEVGAVSVRPAAPAAPLPLDYIDPEHQGDDRELLETFYGACRADGGTHHEIYLRGIKAVLAARPAASPAPEPGEVGES